MAGPDFFTPEWLDENPQMHAAGREPDGGGRTMRPEAGMPDDARALIVVRVGDQGDTDAAAAGPQRRN